MTNSSQQHPQQSIEAILNLAPVVPVVVLDDVEDAVPLARALIAAGLTAIEVTLRTAAALDIIRAIADIEGASAGAGTILNSKQLEAAQKAGACFAVSPGSTERLLDAAEANAIPLLPGVATASEAIRLIERGYQFAKFFPAEPAGGAAYVGALASPLPQLKFCPTGGITQETAPRYLALPNIICVGGSWMLKPEHIKTKNWNAIKLASDAARALRLPKP